MVFWPSFLQNIPDLILITLFSNGMGIIVLLLAPFVLPHLLPNPKDQFDRSPDEREALSTFLEYLFITSWFSEFFRLA